MMSSRCFLFELTKKFYPQNGKKTWWGKYDGDKNAHMLVAHGLNVALLFFFIIIIFFNSLCESLDSTYSCLFCVCVFVFLFFFFCLPLFFTFQPVYCTLFINSYTVHSKISGGVYTSGSHLLFTDP